MGAVGPCTSRSPPSPSPLGSTATPAWRSCRKGGVSTKKVLANLGELSDQMIENLRVALAAARDGKAVVMVEAPSTDPAPPDQPVPAARVQALVHSGTSIEPDAATAAASSSPKKKRTSRTASSGEAER